MWARVWTWTESSDLRVEMWRERYDFVNLKPSRTRRSSLEYLNVLLLLTCIRRAELYTVNCVLCVHVRLYSSFYLTTHTHGESTEAESATDTRSFCSGWPRRHPANDSYGVAARLSAACSSRASASRAPATVPASTPVRSATPISSRSSSTHATFSPSISSRRRLPEKRYSSTSTC